MPQGYFLLFILFNYLASNPLVNRELTVKDLKDIPFVMISSLGTMRKTLERICRRYGFSPNIAIECNDRRLLFRCVTEGMGLTIDSYRALSDEIEKDIVPLKVTDFNEIQTVYVYHRKTGINNTALKSFI